MRVSEMIPFKKRKEKITDGFETVYYPPERDMSIAHEIVGIAARGLVIFCAIFGILHLFYQSVGIYTGESDYRYYSLSAGFLLFVSFIGALVASLIPINRITKTVIPVTSLAALAGLAALRGNPIILVENAARYLYNSFIIYVVKDGYIGMADFVVADTY